MTSYNGHSEDCLCVPCMTADMNAHLTETMGSEYVALLNGDRIATTTDLSVRTRYATPGTKCGRGVVRKLSPRQVAFIKRLMAERDTTNLVRLPGSEDVENMSLKGASDLIERLLACPERAVKSVRMATEKQAEWLGKLAGRDVPAEIEAIRVKGAEATFAEASKALDVLFKAPRPQAPKATTTEEIKEIAGLYELSGEIYRMKKARNGQHFYAEKMVDIETGAWEYAQGYARKVPAEGRKLSLEECEKFSGLLGCCCMCSRTLTATVDGVGPAARFIGPICASKMGF